MKPRSSLFPVVFCAMASAAAAFAAPPPATGQAGLTVAILEFSSTTGNADLGKQVAETLGATLSTEEGFTVVERATLARIMQELALNLSGAISPDEAIKVGKLVGARILVTGSIFPLDKQVMLVAKLVGTETSLVEGVIVKGDKNADIAPLVLDLSAKIAQRLREKGSKLVAGPEEKDPLPALKKLFAGMVLPNVAIRVEERHIGIERPAGIDPAAQTELQTLFRECGFTVIKGDEKELAEAGVTLVIEGQAFSEFGARVGNNLVSCVARLELTVLSRKTNEVVLTDRQTSRAVDLSENIAGKSALQKASHILGIRMLQELAGKLGPGPATKPH